MGELHLEIIVDRLLREFKVEATVGAPQVAYRETIRKSAKAEGRYVRQTGGNGQYGHCWIEISPVEPGEGYSFSNDTVGGSIPKEFIAADRRRYPRGRQERPAGRLRGCGLQCFRVRRLLP